MANMGLHVAKFNDKIRIMNQTNSRDLVLTAQDARNLHAEIFEMLARIAELTEKTPETNVVTVQMDGGGFK